MAMTIPDQEKLPPDHDPDPASFSPIPLAARILVHRLVTVR
jgi:hypothetical protein